MNGQTIRERQRRVREDAILEAAQELMVDQGYAEMSMDDLAARAGVSKATLYQHFPSKEELAINVIVRSMQHGENAIRSQDPALPAIVRLERVMRQAIAGRAAMGSARIMLAPMSVQRHPLYQAQAARMTEALGSLVDAAKAEGDIAAELDTPIVVQMLVSSVRGMSHSDVFYGGHYPPDVLSDQLVRIVFNGIRTQRT
jgi:TetR/AcrR family transcriptional regulator, cholesterol catabolism regulator